MEGEAAGHTENTIMSEIIEKTASSTTNTAPLSATAIAENELGEITWLSSTQGFCECPGKDRHTNQDGRKDCVVYLDRIPSLYCVHSSCAPAIVEANRKLRSAILNASRDSTPRKLTAEDKAKLKEREGQQRLRQRAAKSLPQVLSNQQWTYDQIIADSPVQLTGDEKDHWRLLLEKFEPDDVIWIGDRFHSGKPEHAKHFKTAADWLKESSVPGPLVCPVSFKNNSTARSNDNVLVRRFLVVESDTLTKDQVGAVFKWLRDKVGLELVAIIDTAGKSLHGWFRYPPHEYQVDELKLVLPALGCDPKLFTPSQPVRLPGALRDGKHQKLVYLAKEVTSE
jgi:hypothetical protein